MTDTAKPSRAVPLTKPEMATFARIAESDEHPEAIARAAGPIDDLLFQDFIQELDPRERVLAMDFRRISGIVHDQESKSVISPFTQALIEALVADLPMAHGDVAIAVAEVYAARRLSPVLDEMALNSFGEVPRRVFAMRPRGRMKSRFRLGPRLRKSATHEVERQFGRDADKTRGRKAFRNIEIAIEEVVSRTSELNQFRFE